MCSDKYTTAAEIVTRLQTAGFEAYFAGGCVRDKMLGKEPDDYDVATNAVPDVIEKMFPKTIAVGKAFGVIIVLKNGIEVEVATFRADGHYTDGRHPDSVTFSDLKTDVERRDFTINGMMEDPVKGEIIDLVGGREDLKKGIIRCIGAPVSRFTEDRLRMLRAIRFACQLGFRVDHAIISAIKQMADKITSVSWERIRIEIEKILTSNNRGKGIRMMDEFGLLKHVLPEVSKMKGVQQPPEFHPEGDVYEHTLIALDSLEKPDFILALSVLLHDAGKPDTFMITDRIRFNEHEFYGERIAEKVCRRLKMSRDDIEKVKWLISKHMIFKDVTKMRQSTLKRLLREEYFEELAQLCRADKKAMGAGMEELDYCEQKKREFHEAELKPKPFLRGQDLLEMGLEPGPAFTDLLRAAEDAQLEGALKSKEEAIEFVRKMLNDKNEK
ncbi:MAG: CCA tRNA nucleotidyltransferase [Planctomycetes bacterium]|nr:CCA tRNA nucleotidyltransferase [Planctomycetota bacterium]